jgi:glycosyltransferase involved in cell wall biosynthesis
MLESDGPGGAETVLLHLARALRDRGHTVVPVVRGVSKGKAWLQGQLRACGIEPELWYLRHPIDWKCVQGLMEIFRRRGVDVVHSHEFTMAVYGAAAARLTRRPYLITMHGGRNFAARWRRRAALRWAIRHSRATVAVSRSAADFLETSLQLPRHSVGVVPNGIAYRPGEPARVRDELGLAPGEPLLVAVGSLYPVKGHIVLLKALALLRAECPALEWKAAIAGRGGEEAALRAFMAQNGLESRVKLLGYRTDVPDVLAAADIWVMPSLSEGMPLSLLEAMFAGNAIVASHVGGIPEVVEDGREALLSPPGDAASLAQRLRRLIEDRDLRAALAREAEARAMRDFRLDQTVSEYERLYEAPTTA